MCTQWVILALVPDLSGDPLPVCPSAALPILLPSSLGPGYPAEPQLDADYNGIQEGKLHFRAH